MAKHDTYYLTEQIKKGVMSLNDLTRKQRKAVLQSMSVSKEVREHQRQTQINQNQYTEIKLPKPKNKVKAEKVGLNWSFTQQGFKHFILAIESTFFGKTKEFDGYLIYKANDNEAVLFEQ